MLISRSNTSRLINELDNYYQIISGSIPLDASQWTAQSDAKIVTCNTTFQGKEQGIGLMEDVDLLAWKQGKFNSNPGVIKHFNKGHIYYAAIFFKNAITVNTNKTIGFYDFCESGGTHNTTALGTKTFSGTTDINSIMRCSARFTAQENIEYPEMQIFVNTTNKLKYSKDYRQIDLHAVMILDLTDIYGKGCEPSQEVCDCIQYMIEQKNLYPNVFIRINPTNDQDSSWDLMSWFRPHIDKEWLPGTNWPNIYIKTNGSWT